MTSLIFWGPYLAHKGIIQQKREKQRVKNYERWEGLRDEYDEQRKIARDSRSLDIQRTGQWDGLQYQPTGQTSFDDNDRGILTMRDQQEANDARTGWRPQEAWESPRTRVQTQMTGQVQQYQAQRHISSTPAMPTQMTNANTSVPMRPQRTGYAWDENLPAPLQVSRRSYEDQDYAQRYRPISIGSDRDLSRHSSQTRIATETHTPSGLRGSVSNIRSASPISRETTPPYVEVVSVIEQPKNEFGFVDPIYAKPIATPIAGGRMAELIERGY